MNKLKMNLALIALAFPLLLCAKTQRIEMDIWHRRHRTPIELFVQIEAFFDDYNKELTIKFAQDWEAVTIEIYTPLQFFFINFCREYSGRNI